MRQGHATVCVLLALGLSAAPLQAETLPVSGVSRTYSLYVPPSVAAAGIPAPLVLALHGGRGSGKQLQAWFGLDRVAEREKFVVAYPDGLDGNWNDGRSAVFSASRNGPPDDVSFLKSLVDHLVKRGVAADRRVFATGVSNGGMMSYRLACETRDVFQGFAAMIANLSIELAATCRSPSPVRMLVMNGTADPLMPYGGGTVARNDRGAVLSTDATIALWRAASGCTGTTPGEIRPDRDARDGTAVEVSRSTGCRQNGAVVLFKVIGGGHQMPSLDRAPKPLIDRFLGPLNRDIEAAEEVWAFFAAAPATRGP